MHTALIVLGRETHTRSVLCPLTSKERNLLVRGYGVPEDLLQGHKMRPVFSYGACGGRRPSEIVNEQWAWLVSRTEGPFSTNLFLSDAYFALRAMALARAARPTASLAALHKDCRRISAALSHSARQGFDHCLTVVNDLMQRSGDQCEPDAAAIAAIKAFRPDAVVHSEEHKGLLFASECRRQLAWYNSLRIAANRKRLNTMAVAANLDPGGKDKKEAGGRLPSDMSRLSHMFAGLHDQVLTPVLEKVVFPWLLAHGKEASIAAFLRTPLSELSPFAEDVGFDDDQNLQLLLQLELSFLRSQVWMNAQVSEFELQEHEGQALYEFRTRRSFKTAGKNVRGSLPPVAR